VTGARALLVVAALALAGCGSGDAPRRERPAAGAVVLHETRAGPRTLDLELRSPALGATANVRLLTPLGWNRGATRRWPVLYLLHGCCDTYVSWTRSTAIEDLPRLRRVLVVMPAGGAVGFYSDWRAGPAWERFHLVELRRLLERDYGAGAPRAIAGLSMGGLGALGYAARHPGLFSAAASFSGTLHPLAQPASYLALFAAFTNDPLAIWGDPDADRATWRAHDPTALAPRLRGTRLFVSAGDGTPGPLDPPGRGDDRLERGVERESRALVARLRRLRIPVTADFYGPGTHSWPYWQRELERALPTLLDPAR
jgi:S-formylglutathione hydrolase FrmB